MFIHNLFKPKEPNKLPRNFTNEDKSVIMHLAGKEIMDLKKYLDSCNNKDCGRKYIIEMKYKISKLKPLMLAILNEHCGRFTDTVRVIHIKGMDYLSMIPHYRFTIKNIVIYSKKSGRGSPVLYKIYENDKEFNDISQSSFSRGISLVGFSVLSSDPEDIELLQIIGDYQESTRQNIRAFTEARRLDEANRERLKVMNMEFDDENQ